MTPATIDLDEAGRHVWDAIVVGAGPAGALAARRFALAGVNVLLVDKKSFPRAKVCGSCVNRRALAVLNDEGLGTLVDRIGGIALEQFHLGVRGYSIDRHAFLGKAISRARFDNALVEAAIAAGARFLAETHATIEGCDHSTRGVRLERNGRTIPTRARVVAAASGLGNAALEGEPSIRTRIAARSKIGAGLVVEAGSSAYNDQTIHMAIGRHGYVGLVRVEDGSLNVAAAFDKAFIKACETPARAAAAILREAGFPAIESSDDASWRGTVALSRSTRPVATRRLVLLGDAAGYIEPFTGEGIGWALSSAAAVVPIALKGIERWTSEIEREWIETHRRLIGRSTLVCRGLAFTLRRPRLAAIAAKLVERTPAIADMIIRRINASPTVCPQISN